MFPTSLCGSNIRYERSMKLLKKTMELQLFRIFVRAGVNSKKAYSLQRIIKQKQICFTNPNLVIFKCRDQRGEASDSQTAVSFMPHMAASQRLVSSRELIFIYLIFLDNRMIMCCYLKKNNKAKINNFFVVYQ